MKITTNILQFFNCYVFFTAIYWYPCGYKYKQKKMWSAFDPLIYNELFTKCDGGRDEVLSRKPS